MKSLLAAVVVSFALVGTACGPQPDGRGGDAPGEPPGGSAQQPSPGAPEEQLYDFFGIVMDDADSGPELCVGGVAQSLPPQCGGPALAEWDWETVAGEERMSGSIWGDYYVVGTFDGKTFTLTEPARRRPPERPDPPAEDEFESPCPEPTGGWTVIEPGLATTSDLEATMRAARREPDFAVVWMDYVQGHEWSAENVILNLAFTGDLDRHEKEIREVWGGPLCVSEKPNAASELRRIRTELETEVLAEMGLEMLGSSSDGVSNMVEIEVIVFTADQQAAIDERYGAGKVRLHAALQPLEG